jgi:hypothetical protein
MEPISMNLVDKDQYFKMINDYLFAQYQYDKKRECVSQKDYYNIDKCFIKTINQEEIIYLSDHVLLNGECLFSILYIEIVKFFYSIWNKNDNDPRLQNIINIITEHLIKTSNLSKDEYNEKLNKHDAGCIKGSSLRYYTWWLYVFYPLLPNSTELILKLIEITYLDDAQDSLLYGIYQMKKEQLIEFFPLFIERVCTFRCFNPTSTGTGAKKQVERIWKKINS